MLGAGRKLAGAGLALIAIACGSSPSSSPFVAAPPRSCQTAQDCNDGETCEQNVCAVDPGVRSCSSSDDCLNGWRCGQGSCYRVIDGGSPGAGGSPSAGGSVSTGGADPGAGGSCTADNRRCTANGDCCGFPSSAYCVDFRGGVATCAPLCESNAACTTGCCAAINGPANGLKACAPSTYCAVSGGTGGLPGAGGTSGTGGLPSAGGTSGTGGVPPGTGGSCSAANGTCSTNSECCGYPASVHCVDFGGGVGTCAPLCVSDGSCVTGCCVDLTTNGQPNGSRACAPTAICAGTGGVTGAGGSGGCVAELGACAANGDCCGFPDVNRCFDPGTGIGPVCAVVCETPSGPNGVTCASGCCALLTSGYGVCGPVSFCP